MAIGEEELTNRFGFHAGTADTAPKHDRIRSEFLQFALWLDERLPDGREKACALTALQEAAMWSNTAVAMTAPLVTGPAAQAVRVPMVTSE